MKVVLLAVALLGAVARGQLQDIYADGEYLLDKQRTSLLPEINAARGGRGACAVDWDNKLVEDVRATLVSTKSNGVKECRYHVDPNFAETTYSQYVHTGLDDSITWQAKDVVDEWTNPVNYQTGNVTLWKSITRIGCAQCRIGDRGTAGSGYMVWMICRWEHKTGDMKDNIGAPGDKCDLCKGVTCTAVDACHENGVCDASTGYCSTPLKPDRTPCDDNNSATVEDMCLAGTCQGVDKCAGKVCQALDQCHTAGTCDINTGLCTNPTKPDNTPCNDGNDATTTDVCTAGLCQGTDLCAGVVCTAKSQCHEVGVCNAQTGKCTDPVKLHDTPCDDGDAATTNDKCDGNGKCVGVNLCANVDCPANQCREAGKCNPKTGLCEHVFMPRGTLCDDGNNRTNGDECDGAGACEGVDGCTHDGCGTPFNQCYLPGTCSNSVSGCTKPPKPVGTSCNDSNDATVNDKCVLNPTSGDLECVGENFCNTVDCSANLDQCHEAGTCDFMTGTCLFQNKPDKTPCDDGLVTTTGDECINGVCIGKDLCHAVVCKPEECRNTTGCDPVTGTCGMQDKQDGTLCDDGDDKTVDDACMAGKCVGKDLCASVTCNPTDPCVVSGTCEPHTGKCFWVYKADGEKCDDGDATTFGDRCMSGRCKGGSKCDVELVKKHSQSPCEYKKSYGFTPSGRFYVDDGCRADFRIPATNQEFSCSSWGWKYTECRIFPFRPLCSTKEVEPCPSDKACPGFIRLDEGRCTDKANAQFDRVLKNGVSRAQCMEIARPETGKILGVEYNEQDQACALLVEDGSATNDLFGHQWDAVESGNSGKAPVLKTTPASNWMCWVPEDRCVNVKCVGSDDCHDAGVCEPQTGLCTNPPKPEGSFCDDGDATTWRDTCTKDGKCVGQSTKECWRANSWYKAQTCINDPSACNWAYGVYPSEQKCCEKSFRNGCKQDRKGCWVAHGYWPKKDCADRTGSPICNAPSGVFDSKEECCKPRTGAHHHGCTGPRDDNDDNDDGVADRPEQCQCSKYEDGLQSHDEEYCASEDSRGGRTCVPLKYGKCKNNYLRCRKPSRPSSTGQLCLCGAYRYGAQSSFNTLCVGVSKGNTECFPANSNGKCGKPVWKICVGKRGLTLKLKAGALVSGAKLQVTLGVMSGHSSRNVRIVSVCKKSHCHGRNCGRSRRSMKQSKSCQTSWGTTPSRHLSTLSGEDEEQVVTWEFENLSPEDEDKAIERTMENMEIALNGTSHEMEALTKGKPDLLEALKEVKAITDEPMEQIEAPIDTTEEDIAESQASDDDKPWLVWVIVAAVLAGLGMGIVGAVMYKRRSKATGTGMEEELAAVDHKEFQEFDGSPKSSEGTSYDQI